MKVRNLIVLVAVIAVVVAACDSGEAELSTTSSSSLVTGPTDPPTAATSTSTVDDEGFTSTTLRGETITSFETVARISSENGEILYIVVPEGAYTDVDLENFIGDLLENNPGLWGAEVFDSTEGPEVFVIPEEQRTEEQKQVLDEHHFVSLVGGDTIRYQGPFSEFGEILIGS